MAMIRKAFVTFLGSTRVEENSSQREVESKLLQLKASIADHLRKSPAPRLSAPRISRRAFQIV